MTSSFIQEQKITGCQSDAFVIPTPAYASVQVEGEALRIAVSDGEVIDTYTKRVFGEDRTSEVIDWLRQVSYQHDLYFIAVAFRKQDHFENMASRLWLEEDIVPFEFDEDESISIWDQLRAAIAHFEHNHLVVPKFDLNFEVQVAKLVRLDDYRKTTSPGDFALAIDLACAFRGKRLAFVNATPRGGGVAIMRHALIRFLHLLGVDAHWYVLQPRKEAFDITKAKFHNVLQDVASPETVLTQADKVEYISWMRANTQVLKGELQQADVIVIDDPQPAGLIPFIKDINPRAKVIYRSHIQIVGELASRAGTPQEVTWSFLWESIKDADYFISHPLKSFIPDNVPAEKTLYMPATTDPLDGLNKPLTDKQRARYMRLFQIWLKQAGQTPLDLQRPYIIQIARFDPSKGIPDVLEAYWKLRIRLEEQHQVIPQLVVAGNSSVDDPDGIPVFHMIKHMLQMEPYVHFADDIKVIRLPHMDQMLNTLLRESKVALQLSTKEGFEVKVTEALMKGKPVIAYRVGGIPLQIEDGVTGYLLEAGNTAAVAQHLYELLTDEQKYQQMSNAASTYASSDYLTVPNAICWLYLALNALQGRDLQGNYQWVKALAEQSMVLEKEIA